MGEGVGWTGWVRGLNSQPGATLMLAAVKPCSLSPVIRLKVCQLEGKRLTCATSWSLSSSPRAVRLLASSSCT